MPQKACQDEGPSSEGSVARLGYKGASSQKRTREAVASRLFPLFARTFRELAPAIAIEQKSLSGTPDRRDTMRGTRATRVSANVGRE